ncbi:MAG: GNAT family N-acetyltransferase [Parvibaculum sp.]
MCISVWKRDDFEISTDLDRLNKSWLVAALKATYWAAPNSPETIWKSIVNSNPYGIYSESGDQVGFARLVTDTARFAWVSDVVMDPAMRGRGLGKWLMETMVNDPAFSTVHLWMLATDDAHGLYEQYGFKRSEATELRSQIMHLSRTKS